MRGALFADKANVWGLLHPLRTAVKWCGGNFEGDDVEMRWSLLLAYSLKDGDYCEKSPGN